MSWLALVSAAGTMTPGGVATAQDRSAGAADARVHDAGRPEDAAARARAVVARLEDAFLDLMKRAETLGFEGRLRTIAPVIEETFDLPFMAQLSIGRTWHELEPELRTRWTETFSRHTTAKFADRFDRYSGQEFVITGTRPASRDTVVVLSRIDRPALEPVRLDFRLHETVDGWRIIDVYGKGTVSELALRRSEYDGILKERGIEGLIESVDELTARATADSGSSDAGRDRTR